MGNVWWCSRPLCRIAYLFDRTMIITVTVIWINVAGTSSNICQPINKIISLKYFMKFCTSYFLIHISTMNVVRFYYYFFRVCYRYRKRICGRINFLMRGYLMLGGPT